jgi:hypothetical protein
MDGRLAAFVARRNIEKSNLVGARITVTLGDFDRIAGVTNVDELHAFDDATVFTV